MNEWILVGAVVGGTVIMLGGWGMMKTVLSRGGRGQRRDHGE